MALRLWCGQAQPLRTGFLELMGNCPLPVRDLRVGAGHSLEQQIRLHLTLKERFEHNVGDHRVRAHTRSVWQLWSAGSLLVDAGDPEARPCGPKSAQHSRSGTPCAERKHGSLVRKSVGYVRNGGQEWKWPWARRRTLLLGWHSTAASSWNSTA